jgi:erythromycin esterase
MASNLSWILDHSPDGSRAVVWAHNLHISKGKQRMGWFLDKQYGRSYLAATQTCFAGTYTARVMGSPVLSLSSGPIAPPLPGSFEWFCHSTGVPIFALDVRSSTLTDDASAWLKQPILMRHIGAAIEQNQQSESRITDEYDLVVCFENTNSTDCFDVKKNAR